MKATKRYLFPSDYMADPSVHVFNGKLYIYPSHDNNDADCENDNGDQYVMRDMHVLSTDDPMNGLVADHGQALDIADIPWAGRQLWDCDCAEKDGKYYLYFPLKDKNDIFRIGVATADRPEGPFVPQPDPIRGSYSMDICVFQEDVERGRCRGGTLHQDFHVAPQGGNRRAHSGTPRRPGQTRAAETPRRGSHLHGPRPRRVRNGARGLDRKSVV